MPGVLWPIRRAPGIEPTGGPVDSLVGDDQDRFISEIVALSRSETQNGAGAHSMPRTTPERILDRMLAAAADRLDLVLGAWWLVLGLLLLAELLTR